MYTSGWYKGECHLNDNERPLTGADMKHCGTAPVPADGWTCCGVFKCNVPASAPAGKCRQERYVIT